MSYLLTDADKKEFAEIEGAEAEINEMTTDIVALEAYRDGLAVTTGQGIALGKTARNLMGVGLGNLKHAQVSLEDAEGESVEADKGRMAKIGAKIKEIWLKMIAKIKATIAKIGEFVKTRLSMADFYKRAAIKALAELKANPLSEEAVTEGWKAITEGFGKKITQGEASPWNDLTYVSDLLKDTRDTVNVFVKQRTIYNDLANAVTAAMDKGAADAATAFDFGKVEKANQALSALGKGDRWTVKTNRTVYVLDVNLMAVSSNSGTVSKEATGASIAVLTTALNNAGAGAKVIAENSAGLLDTVLFSRQIGKINKFVKTFEGPMDEKFNEFDKVAREVALVLNESVFGYLSYYGQAIGGARLIVKTYEAARKAQKAGAKPSGKEEGSAEEAGK